MILSDKIKRVQDLSDFVFWVASLGENNICELSRVSGFIIENDNEHITFFLPMRLFSMIEPTLKKEPKISFLMASLKDFESYQIKGEYKNHQFCTEENVDFFRLKVLKIIDILNDMGLDGKSVFGYLLDQPSIAITMHCSEIFEQTPKPGTGEKITE